jgi:hypothetical protein
MIIDITSKQLFGNEAGEDENEDVFKSYVVNRPEIGEFLSEDNSISIVRAYKGEGKSALLRLVALDLKKKPEPPIVIYIRATSISPELTDSDSDRWIRGWKSSILRLAAKEIGKSISLAFSDDAISLVEEAEANGFKARNFVSVVVDRLKSSAIPIARERQGVGSPEQLLQRWASRGEDVWFIIDDLDLNFENNPLFRAKVATFFNAIRQISSLIPTFKFRASVRPNVWSIIKREYESLSHVEQYITDLQWSLEEFQTLIARRIEGYLERTSQLDAFDEYIKENNKQAQRERSLVGLVFKDPMPWGNDQTRPAATTLYTLARQRPRWLVELWKVSANSAKKKNSNIINLPHINSELESFGQRRIDDTVAEFKSQCPQVEELLVAFINEPEWFSTADLVDKIKRKIIDKGVQPKIGDVIGAPSVWEIAHFLYQISFLTARKDLGDGRYEHFSYASNPRLLSVRTNLDQGHSWEIHPVFRQALKLKNA